MMALSAAPQIKKLRDANIRPVAVFEPLEWQIAPWRCTEPVILLTGSAGGGKSRLAAEKLHAYCLKYPGAQGLVMRKYRETMTAGTIRFLEKVVIGDDPRVQHVRQRFSFEYSNGSVLTYIGLNDERGRVKLRSIGQDGAVDIAWMEEAIEFDYEDHNELTTRMRGKAGPFRQRIYTTNPDSDTHWINVKLIQGGGATVFYSQTSDNPHNPDEYRTDLAGMTGVRADRMVKGLWVKATGLVYDQWLDDYGKGLPPGQEKGNVTLAAEYVPDDSSTVFWMVDDGYVGEQDPNTGYFTANSHPRAFLLAQVRPNGQLAVFEEHLAVKKLEPNHIDEVLKVCEERGYKRPEFAVVDKSAAALKGWLQSKDIATRNGAPSVEESIKMLQNMLAPDTNGFRRVIVHPRCKHVRSEANSYRRDPNTQLPIKQFDHAMDALRYGAWTFRQLYGV